MPVNAGPLYEKLRFQEPQITLTCPASGRMWLVSFCAFITVMQSALTDSFSSLILAVVSVVAAVVTDFFILNKSNRAALLKDGSTVASALILALLLPNKIAPIYAVMGSIFAVVVIKHGFGGLGSNWLNPAAGGWLFIRLSWPVSFSRALEGSPLSLLTQNIDKGFSSPGASPIEILAAIPGGISSHGGFMEAHLRPFLNNTVFSFLKIEMPEYYLGFLTSQSPGLIVDRGILALILGTVIINIYQAGRTLVPVLWLAIFIFFTRLSGTIPFGAGWWKGDVFFALCSGGTLAAAFILALDPVTSAKSSWCIYGTAVIGGFFAWLFRYPGAEAYGAIYSVLVINALLPAIRSFENRLIYQKRRVYE